MNLTRPALVLIVLGLLLGPGYYVYCEYLSGEEVARHELRERADRWTLPDGSIQRFSGHLAYQPVILELTPERNDVRLRLTFHAASDAPAGENRYLATLEDVDHPVRQQDLEIRVAPGAAQSVNIGAFPVRIPAEHVFILEEVGKPAATVSHVILTAEQGVQRLIPALAGTGVALLLAGAVLLVYAMLVRGR
jgi:hypothetical protein